MTATGEQGAVVNESADIEPIWPCKQFPAPDPLAPGDSQTRNEAETENSVPIDGWGVLVTPHLF
jgi:hypothetical protein